MPTTTAPIDWTAVLPKALLSGTCPRCGHKFECARSTTRDRAEEIGGGVIASCPECQHDTYPEPKEAAHESAPVMPPATTEPAITMHEAATVADESEAEPEETPHPRSHRRRS